MRTFCHSYDLSKPANETLQQLRAPAAKLNIPSDLDAEFAAQSLYQKLYQKLFDAIREGFKK